MIDWREAFLKYAGIVALNAGVSFLEPKDWISEEWEELDALFAEVRRKDKRRTITQSPDVCEWCSSRSASVSHNGFCPRVRAIEYHQTGLIKRVEFLGQEMDEGEG